MDVPSDSRDAAVRSLYTMSSPGGRWLPVVMFSTWLLGGCALIDGDSGTSDDVRFQAKAGSIVVTNGLDERIYHFVVGREFAARLDWVAHLDEEQSVAAGASAALSYESIPMEEGETQAIAYWWLALTRDGERVPGPVESTIVDL